MTIKTGDEYDVFLSHASEDKPVVLELAKLLQARDVRVWIDQGQLKLGDTLLEKIDEGLARSRFGVVVLSPRFFAKAWTKLELAGLVSRETVHGAKVILPIWHELSYEDVAQHSPILAGKLAARTEDGLEAIADQIVDVLRSPAAAPGQVVATDHRDPGKLSPGELHDQVEGLLQLKDDVGLNKLLRDEQRSWELQAVGTVGRAQPASVEAVHEVWKRLRPAAERRLASLMSLATHDVERFKAEIRSLSRTLQRLPSTPAVTWFIVPEFATTLIVNVVGIYLTDAERYDLVVWLIQQSTAGPRHRASFGLSAIPHPGHPHQQALAPELPGNGELWRFPFWTSIVELPGQMPWLLERYPELVDRDRRIATLVGFDLIRGLSMDGSLAYYALHEELAIKFAIGLHTDPHRRDELSRAVGNSTEEFPTAGAAALRKNRELGWDYGTGYIAEALESGR